MTSFYAILFSFRGSLASVFWSLFVLTFDFRESLRFKTIGVQLEWTPVSTFCMVESVFVRGAESNPIFAFIHELFLPYFDFLQCTLKTRKVSQYSRNLVQKNEIWIGFGTEVGTRNDETEVSWNKKSLCVKCKCKFVLFIPSLISWRWLLKLNNLANMVCVTKI